MPSTDVLEAAGRRAAYRPVPTARSIDDLIEEVGRRRNKRRRVAGGVAAAVVAAVAIPLGVVLIDGAQPEVVTTLGPASADEVTSAEPANLASQSEPSATSTPAEPTAPSTSAGDELRERSPFAGLSDENFDLRLDLGDSSFAIVVITGDDAAARANDAAASADETREIDDQTIWIDERGDEVSASALFDDDTFVEVVGPGEQIDRVLDLVTEHANGPVRFFDHDGFAERFDLPEGLFDSEGLFDGEFPFGEDFPFEPFFDDDALENFRSEMRNFSECMDITVDRSGNTTSIEIPDCEFPALDGLFDGEAFGNLPFDVEELFENLPKDLEGLFENSLEDAS